MTDSRRRRGFTLVTTMWILSVGSMLTMAFALAGRDAFNASSNRVRLERARWKALGCARRVQAAIDEAFDSARTDDDAENLWRGLYAAIDASTLLSGCDVALEAAGTRLDVNSASDESMTRLVSAIDGIQRADSLSDAFGDWRDTDDITRPLGAERNWYAAQSRVLPRNDALADNRELAFVRGFEEFGRFDSLVTTEEGRVSLATAPSLVLQSVPGIGPELADRIVERRATTTITDLADVIPLVSERAADELRRHYPDASRLTTPEPDAWILTVRAACGSPGMTADLQWRLVRAAVRRRVRVLRVRSRT